MHLQFDDPEAHIERGLVQCAGRVESGDNLLAGVLRGSVIAGIYTVGRHTHIDDFLCGWASSTLSNIVLKADG